MPRHAYLSPFLIAAAGLGGLSGCAEFDPVQHGVWGERVVADVAAMPGYWMRIDRDDDVTGDLVDTAGPGWSARFGIGNADQSVGVLYHGAYLEEDDGDAEVDVHALFLDFDVSVPIEPQGFMFVHAGAGLGMAHLASPDDTIDTTTGAANLRMHLELRPNEHLAFLAGIGGFAFGSTGDTEAYGTFLDLGLRVTF